jgi:hypothetical protein
MLLLPVACSVTLSPPGSSATGYRRVDSPGSIFSIANRPSNPAELNNS